MTKPEIICGGIGVEVGIGDEFSISLTTMKITNSDGVAGFAELIEREETLVATACNHPNLLVLPIILHLFRTAA
jgi:hypothetical protein